MVSAVVTAASGILITGSSIGKTVYAFFAGSRILPLSCHFDAPYKWKEIIGPMRANNNTATVNMADANVI